MTLEQFCTKLVGLDLNQPDQALSILWYHDEKQPDIVMSAGQLAKVLRESGLGNPNSTLLRNSIDASGKVLSVSGGFRLKMLTRGDRKSVV